MSLGATTWRDRQRGSVLLPVVVAITLLAAITFMLSYQGVSQTNVVAGEFERDRLRYVAEAGIAHARSQLALNTSCDNYADIPKTAFAGETYSVKFSPSKGSPIKIKSSVELADGKTLNINSQNIAAYEPATTVVLQLSDTSGEDTVLDGVYLSRNYGGASSMDLYSGSQNKRPVLRFPLDKIPANATIQLARLELRQWNANIPGQVTVHRLTRDWVEGTLNGGGSVADGATWQTHDGSSSWSQPGGDYDPAVYASSYVTSGGVKGWDQWDVTSLVQEWVSGKTPNYGLLLLGDGTAGNIQWASRETNNPPDAPKLTIVYACECGKTCIAEGGGPQPIAHWKFDETIGTTAIDSAGGHDGTLVGDASWAPGVVDGSLSLDGSGDRVDVSGLIDSPQSLTITAWVNLTSTDFFGAEVIDLGDNILLRLDNGFYDTYVSFWDGSSWQRTRTGQFIAGSGWRHVAYTHDDAADQQYFYIDGVEAASTTFSTSISYSHGSNTTIGAKSGGNSNYDFNGQIDDLRIYDVALTAEQIAEIAAEDGSTGPVAHWKLDETTGFTAVDSVGGNDATLQNGPLWTTGQVDGGLDFDGVDDAASAGAPATLDDIFDGGGTLTAWMHPDGWGEGNYGRIVDKSSATYPGNGWALELYGANASFLFQVGFSGATGSWITPNSSLSLDAWQHVALVYDNSSDANDPLIYIDGVDQAITELDTPSGTLRSDAGVNFTIGNHAMSTVRTFNGQLDDVRVYDRMLSAAEIAELAAMGGGSGGGGGGGGGCDGNFRDNFDARAWNGSNGTLSWATDWLEVGESDGASSGDIQIRNDQSNYQLRTRDNDNGGEGVEREADLSGAASATLNYDYRRMNLDNTNDYTSVEISANGASGPWTELTRHDGSGNDSSYQPASHPITPHISATTRIRFKTSSTMGGTDTVWFDNVEIVCTP